MERRREIKIRGDLRGQPSRRESCSKAIAPSPLMAVDAILVGPEGRYVTGQTIHVNGGLFLAK